MDTYWAVVVAQFVKRSLPTPEVRGSNQVIGEVLFIINCIEKTKIKKRKRDREWPINKKTMDTYRMINLAQNYCLRLI